MAYSKTTFNEGAAPGISAAELNKIGTGIEEAAPLADPVFSGTPKVGSATMVTSANIETYVDTGDQVGGVIYVDIVNGVDAEGRGTSVDPYKTITYAMNTLKKNLIGNILLALRPGTYSEVITISNFSGAYNFEIASESSANKDTTILTGYITVNSMNTNTVIFRDVTIHNALDARTGYKNLVANSCNFASTINPYGILMANGFLDVNFCNFTGKTTCMSIGSNTIAKIASNNTGSSNTVGIEADNGAIVTVDGVIALGATTMLEVATGGNIFNVPSGKIWV